MRKIIYGIFAEDDANKLFIMNVLPQLVAHFEVPIELEHQEHFTSMAVAKNSEFVVDNFMSRAVHGIRYFNLDLCIVSVDSEDRNFEEMLQKMNTKLPNQNLEHKVFVFIPVQCIEYWLWYLKFSENTEQIEYSKSRRSVKIEVYGSANPSNRKSNPVVKSISQQVDLELLAKKSESFAYFFQAFKMFLDSLKKTKE
jgi:hypothetical protein